MRWQFRGGIDESERQAFLFTNVTDARGRKFDMPVVVGALAANAEIYAIGMNAPIEEIGARWERGVTNPIPPRIVDEAPCQEVVWTGDDLVGEGKGLDALPVPISTPGFDVAPYFTATNVVTRDPETGVQNMGTYRAGLKASEPARACAWRRAKAAPAATTTGSNTRRKGEKRMPCSIAVGCPPVVAYLGPQKLGTHVDEPMSRAASPARRSTWSSARPSTCWCRPKPRW